MYCTDWKKGSGFVQQADSDLWVHSECGKPTRQVLEKLTNMRAPKNAKAIISYHGHLNGTATMTFALDDGTRVQCMYYNPYPAKVDMNRPQDLLLKFWHNLDNMMDQLMSVDLGPNDKAILKVKARALAEVVAEIMSPFYSSPDAVVNESVARYNARQAGTEHTSPGLAESIWDPSTRFDGTPYSVANEERARSGGSVARTKTAPRPTGNSIPAAALPTVKQALESGMFTTKQIATTYSMNEDEVKTQLGLA